MGHIVNPLSYRLYNTRYWNNTWFSLNNYSYLANQDILLGRFINKFFFNSFKSLGIIMFNLRVIRVFKNLSLYLYIHDSYWDYHVTYPRELKSLREGFNYLRIGRGAFFKTVNKLFSSYKKSKLFNSKQSRQVGIMIARLFRSLMSFFFVNFYLKKLWQNFKVCLTLFLYRIFESRFNFLNIFIVNVYRYGITANMISEFILIRLKQYYTVWEVLKNISFLFKILMYRKGLVKGYKITCSGRFSRKQRTTFSWRKFGNLSFSSMKSRLDYSYRSLALKYSTVTIKVWIRFNFFRKRKKPKKIEFIV